MSVLELAILLLLILFPLGVGRGRRLKVNNELKEKERPIILKEFRSELNAAREN